MKGYVCDRCRATGVPQWDLKDRDSYPPEGWLTIQVRGSTVDLCADCTSTFEDFMKGGGT